VSSFSAKDCEGPGDCGSGIFTAEEVDGVGDDKIMQSLLLMLKLPDLGLFSSNANVSEFLD
jgi:hypothetical protein